VPHYRIYFGDLYSGVYCSMNIQLLIQLRTGDKNGIDVRYILQEFTCLSTCVRDSYCFEY